MDAEAIARAFGAINPAHTDDYTIVDGSPVATAHLAMSRDGAPSVIVPVTHVTTPITRLTTALALHAVQELEFVQRSTRSRSPAVVIECRDRGLLRTFGAMVSCVLARLPTKMLPTSAAVVSLFSEWERLLARRRMLANESELGLWGELWCLAHGAPTLLGAWRGPMREHVDFVLDGEGFEVKTSRSAGVHMVSQEQVTQPLGKIPVTLVSLHVASDPLAGRTLAQLVDAVSTRAPDHAMFEEKLAATGYAHEDAANYTNAFVVVSEPLFFDTEKVPRVRVADAGVSRLRYQVELPSDAAVKGDRRDALVAVIGIDPVQLDFPCA